MDTRAIPELQASGIVDLKQNVNGRTIFENNNVTILNEKESTITKINKFLHEKDHRFGGYIAHKSRASARSFVNKLEIASRTQIVHRYTIDNKKVSEYLKRNIITKNLEKTAYSFSRKFKTRYYNTLGGMKASQWIYLLWKRIGSKLDYIRVRRFKDNTPSWSPQPSVIATIKGTSTNGEIVIVSAHIDSINEFDGKINNSTLAPGADDNASGTSVVTELLRVIVKTGFRPKKTIKLIGYGAEEVGLRGSQSIVQYYSLRGKNVIGVLNLDMVGYKGSDKDLYILTDYTNPAQNQFLSNLAKEYLPNSSYGYGKCGYGCSDHVSWYYEGVPASFIFESQAPKKPYINPHYHSKNDVKIDKNHIKTFAKISIVYLAELAKGEL